MWSLLLKETQVHSAAVFSQLNRPGLCGGAASTIIALSMSHFGSLKRGQFDRHQCRTELVYLSVLFFCVRDRDKTFGLIRSIMSSLCCGLCTEQMFQSPLCSFPGRRALCCITEVTGTRKKEERRYESERDSSQLENRRGTAFTNHSVNRSLFGLS